MNEKLKTELLRALYAALGAAAIAFLQTLLAYLGGAQLPETSTTLNLLGGLLAARIK